MGFLTAWSIQMRETSKQIVMFLEATKAKALKIKPDWKPACFIIDCADAEVKALQAVFPGIPIYFCSWHVRRYVIFPMFQGFLIDRVNLVSITLIDMPVSIMTMPNTQTFTSPRSFKAWKDGIIKKAKDKSKILEMNDELGDLMYAACEEKMQALWDEFKENFKHETNFISYFEKEWMGKTGMS